MDRHALEAEVMLTFASQVLRPMILSYGLHDQCLTIGREFVKRNRGLYTWSYAKLTDQLEGVSYPRIFLAATPMG